MIVQNPYTIQYFYPNHEFSALCHEIEATYTSTQNLFEVPTNPRKVLVNIFFTTLFFVTIPKDISCFRHFTHVHSYKILNFCPLLISLIQRINVFVQFLKILYNKSLNLILSDQKKCLELIKESKWKKAIKKLEKISEISFSENVTKKDLLAIAYLSRSLKAIHLASEDEGLKKAALCTKAIIQARNIVLDTPYIDKDPNLGKLIQQLLYQESIEKLILLIRKEKLKNQFDSHNRSIYDFAKFIVQNIDLQ